MSKMIFVNIAEMLYFGERHKHYWLTISSNCLLIKNATPN